MAPSSLHIVTCMQGSSADTSSRNASGAANKYHDTQSVDMPTSVFCVELLMMPSRYADLCSSIGLM